MGRKLVGNPEDFRLIVAFLRSLRKWSQEELAKVSGVDRGLISDYEQGKTAPTRKTLERLTAAVGLPYRWIEKLLPLFRSARLALEGDGLAAELPEGDASGGLGSGLDQALVDAVMPVLVQDLMELEALVAQSGEEARPKAEDRILAAELWASLEMLPPERLRLTVERERKYWSWALVERLCDESVQSAAHRADRAAELAGLALRIAELSPGTEAWRWRLQGYAWAFVANARRVEGDLPGAEAAFLSSDCSWGAGAPADQGLLNATRRLDLKASLRRHQGRFVDALALLDQTLLAACSGEARGSSLINRANTLRLMGDSEGAIAELQKAKLLVGESRDSRIPWMAQHGLVHNLWKLGRYAEAETLLPAVRRGAVEMGNELDLVRTLWVEGGVAAGLGKRGEALTALEEVRRYFTANEIAYDAALASLELAVLYLEEGETGEVKRLAEEMYWIFKAQGVQKEALAAIRLFCEVAEREAATVDLARRVAGFLQKARYEPALRFEG